MDTTPLRDAYRALLDAAATVAGSGASRPARPAGEWNADQILAHVSLISAATIAAASAIAAGANTTYDNRTSLDTWTIDRVTGLDTLLPTRLLSNGTVLVDQPVALRDILAGLAEIELPGHTQQLLALRPDRASSIPA
jgi:hypothetical protein